MNFSIITCTYNPNLEIFERLVNAVNNLTTDENTGFEWIIVDNNCTKPIKEISFIKEQLDLKPNYKIIEEKKPGLTNARIAGVKASKYGWIIFFDDDNEPGKDYLMNTSVIIKEYPQVACWGPGNIFVEYIGAKNTNSNIHLQNLKELFQERHHGATAFNNNFEYDFAYPCGTGMIISRQILLEYIRLVIAGKITLNDRTGKNLTSGGDTQLVYLTIRLGFFAGHSNLLKLNHLILFEKTKMNKILQLVYMLNSASIKGYNEIFEIKYIGGSPSNNQVLQAIKRYLTNLLKWKSSRDSLYKLVQQLGIINAQIIAGNFRKPILIKLIEKYLLKV